MYFVLLQIEEINQNVEEHQPNATQVDLTALNAIELVTGIELEVSGGVGELGKKV